MRNLGVAMGAAVDELRQQKRDELQERQMGLQESAGRRADEQHGWQRGEQERATKIKAELDGAVTWGKQLQEAWASGDPEKQHMAAQELSKYHTGSGFMGGSQSAVFRGADGKMFVAAGGGEAGPPQVRPLDHETFQSYLDKAVRYRITSADPSLFMSQHQADRQFGLKQQEIDQTGKYRAGMLERYDADRVSREKLALAQIAAARANAQGREGVGRFVPLQTEAGPVSYNERTGQYMDPTTGKLITDPATLAKINRVGNPGRGAPPVMSFKDFAATNYASGDMAADIAKYNRLIGHPSGPDPFSTGAAPPPGANPDGRPSLSDGRGFKKAPSTSTTGLSGLLNRLGGPSQKQLEDDAIYEREMARIRSGLQPQ